MNDLLYLEMEEREEQTVKENLYRNRHKYFLLERQVNELQSQLTEKDKQIEKMKCCFNCKYRDKFVDAKCDKCDNHFSKWELAE